MGSLRPDSPDDTTRRYTAPAPLRPTHRLADFTCGEEVLDHWLKRVALRAEARTARTFVVCVGDDVVGFYCLSAGSVERATLPRTLRKDVPDVVPVVLIGRLVVATAYQGRGLGAGLLKDALLRAVQVSREVGCRAVLVHAVNADAAAFYTRYGFTPFPGSPFTFSLALETIVDAL